MKKLILVMIIAAGTLSALTATAEKAAKQWTFMVYLDADNNLEPDGIDDFLEMAEVGSTDDVNIVVQMDRVSGTVASALGYADDTRYGDWSICNRFLVTKGMTPTEDSAIADWGDGKGGGREVNMADKQTAIEFFAWAVANYPASNYAVVYWNHGGGWKSQLANLKAAMDVVRSDRSRLLVANRLNTLGNAPHRDVCWDDTTYYETGVDDYLSTKECQEALATGTPTGLALVGFDVCLAGMIEVAYQLKETGATVMVGSEQLEPGAGWPYDTILADLTATPTMSASDFGKVIVNRYAEYYSAYGDVTQSAMDLTKIGTLATQVSAFASAMENYWQTDAEQVKTEADNVMTALTNAVILHKHGSDWDDKAYGISINFPTSGPDSDYTTSVINFAETNWPSFLSAYSSNMRSSWIATARNSCDTFGVGDPFVDIYQFASNVKSGGGGSGDYDTVLVYKSCFKTTLSTGKSSHDSYLVIEFATNGETYGSCQEIAYDKQTKLYATTTSGMTFTTESDSVVGQYLTTTEGTVLAGDSVKSTDIGLGRSSGAYISTTFNGTSCYYTDASTWGYAQKCKMKFDKKLTQTCNESGSCTLDQGVDVVESYLEERGYYSDN